MVLRVILALLAGLAALVASFVGLIWLVFDQILAAGLTQVAGAPAQTLAQKTWIETLTVYGTHVALALSFLTGSLVAGWIARGWEVPTTLILWLALTLTLITVSTDMAAFTPLSLIATTLPAVGVGGGAFRLWRRWRADRAARAQLAVF